MIDHLFRFVQEDLASFGDLDAGDDLIIPEKREELKADLEKRLGFIKVYYHLPKGESNSVNMITRAKDYVE